MKGSDHESSTLTPAMGTRLFDSFISPYPGHHLQCSFGLGRCSYMDTTGSTTDASSVSFWSTFVLQLLLTVGCGLWLAQNVEREPPLHGLLMGLFTALIFLTFSISFNVAALVVPVIFVLTVAAGWLGGFLGSPRRQ